MPAEDYDDAIDLRELARRLWRGMPQSLGLAALGLAIAGLIYVAAGPQLLTSTSTRVVFSFPGYERGEYPDRSKFQSDDLRSPEIVSEALKRQGLATTEEFQSRVRAALTIEGIIPTNLIKERDRLRAAGQTPPRYVPDEYTVTLSLPRKFPLAARQRELLLNEIVSVYMEKFHLTYAAIPLGFGGEMESLSGADYSDYELVLNQESQNITAYLQAMAEEVKGFRSPRTNLSFSDLLKQNQLFTQLRLNETLGLIRQFGLSRDRRLALLKMDYHLRSLSERENSALEEERHIQSLLSQAQERAQSYVLGVKSQAVQQRPDSPVIDQGLVDSLLANDAYNFLVRQALEAGLKTRRIQAEKAVLQERRNRMEEFIQASVEEKAEVMTQLDKSLAELKASYAALIENIRLTHEDYQRQRFGDALRISMQARTESFYLSLAKAGIVGLALGGALGVGLSLLGVYVGRRV